MPKLARVIQFPAARAALPISPSEAREIVASHLSEHEQRGRLSDHLVLDADVLSALSESLRQLRDSAPVLVADESIYTYGRLSSAEDFGVFDERDYFLGEFSFLAGGAYRLMGKRDDAVEWLNRADSHFRHTVDPTAGLAGVAYARLALTFDAGNYERVVSEIGAVRDSFSRLGVQKEKAKCDLLEAFAQKQLGKTADALVRLSEAAKSLHGTHDRGLLSRVLVETGDIYQLQDQVGLAIACFERAAELISTDPVSIFSADVKMFLGGAYRSQNQLALALASFRAAQRDSAELELATRSAYLRLLAADTLLRMERSREAEWEILAALPTIDEQKMVPESLAAIGLLKEAVRQRKVDPALIDNVLKGLQ
jgi:tetratricopeptide (TPR) repeat protein